MLSLICFAVLSAFHDDFEEFTQVDYDYIDSEEIFDDELPDFIPANCGICVKLITRASESKKTDKEELRTLLRDEVCKKVSALMRVCYVIADNLLEKAYEELLSGVEPMKTCQKFRYC
ncbi:hypothetical protein BLNAU_7680 [Blattamonas nauphoetae]|uniref:Saposin B-type domain-containing protein n=1 Tax=Blattamonas nauphoetae TaxID=2049346 RepID=A0ABQ9Y0N4_9EUKA|nr:hypothetical protein BLNAU_7680 [Blattamonas nauphoetae]